VDVLPWDHLRFALAIARHGNLTGAARALGVDLTTVSRRLTALETAAGATLFLRTHSGLLPTDAGRSVLRAAERMEEEMPRVQRALAPKRHPHGPVRVASSEVVAENWLRESGPALREKLDGLELVLIPDSPPVNLVRGEADLAIRLERPDREGLVARKLGDVGHGLYAARRYLAEQGRPRSGADLSGQRVVLGTGPLARSAPGVWMSRASRGAATVVLRTESFPVLRAAVESGLGLGVLPTGSEELHPQLVRLAPLLDVNPSPVWLLMPRNVARNSPVRRVARLIEQTLGAAYRRWQQRG
jgi:DNA-binding transcriptional LysR family regulator